MATRLHTTNPVAGGQAEIEEKIRARIARSPIPFSWVHDQGKPCTFPKSFHNHEKTSPPSGSRRTLRRIRPSGAVRERAQPCRDWEKLRLFRCLRRSGSRNSVTVWNELLRPRGTIRVSLESHGHGGQGTARPTPHHGKHLREVRVGRRVPSPPVDGLHIHTSHRSRGGQGLPARGRARASIPRCTPPPRGAKDQAASSAPLPHSPPRPFRAAGGVPRVCHSSSTRISFTMGGRSASGKATQT